MNKPDSYHIQENVFQALSTNDLYGTIVGNISFSNNITDFLSVSVTHPEIVCQIAGIHPGEIVFTIFVLYPCKKYTFRHKIWNHFIPT